MLVRKNFSPPPANNFCKEKKIRPRDYKKKIDTAKNKKKIIVHIENGPPPHHFSNGPSLIDARTVLMLLNKIYIN
jgi:hypothetical protein